MLNEEDVLFGLWKRRGAAEETRAALSCIQHGVLQPGQDYLLDAIRKAANNQFPPMSAGQLPCPSHCCHMQAQPFSHVAQCSAQAISCSIAAI